MLQHPLLSQRRSWGHTPQEMLTNDLTPASPKSVSPGLVKAIAPATEEVAKLKVIERETLQTQPSCVSPGTVKSLPGHHSELHGAFLHQPKFSSPSPSALCMLPRLPQGFPAQASNSLSICSFRDRFS